MPREEVLIDAYLKNFTDGDLSMKVWSENVDSDDGQNEEYKDQNILKRELRFFQIYIQQMTDKRSTEYIQTLIISEFAGKSVDEVLI